MPLSELLEFLLDQRQHITLVIDEYGGTKGLVTIEDVVETLLGMEIVDEMDRVEDMRALARRQWEKRAKAFELRTKTDE
jgi:CBS domain containing-hemolysin-like protein